MWQQIVCQGHLVAKIEMKNLTLNYSSSNTYLNGKVLNSPTSRLSDTTISEGEQIISFILSHLLAEA